MTANGQPDWFRDALAAEYTDASVAVEGTDIHYLEWGERGRPGLVFVHGGGWRNGDNQNGRKW